MPRRRTNHCETCGHQRPEGHRAAEQADQRAMDQRELPERRRDSPAST